MTQRRYLISVIDDGSVVDGPELRATDLFTSSVANYS
jgi:hypothetical protein